MATAVNPPVLPPGFEIDPPHQQGGISGHMLPAGFEADPPPYDPVAGAAKLVGSGLLNIPHAAIAGVQDLFNRVTGNGGAPTTDFAKYHMDPDSDEARLAADIKNSSVGKAVSNLVGAASSKINSDDSMTGELTRQGLGVMGDVAQVAPGAGVLSEIGSGVKGAMSAAAEAAGVGTDWNAAGLRTGGAHPIAREVAGDSGKPALKEHNTTVGNTIAANEAGHDPTKDMSYESLADARSAPNSVYNRVANTLPDDGQIDPSSAGGQMIKNAGLPEGGRMSDGSPDAAAKAKLLQTQLLDPNKTFNGQQIVNEVRGLRQEGFTNAASDDTSNQQLGKAQLDMARGIEQHIADTLPQNGPVSLPQFQGARQQLAKNYTVQSALRGSDVDAKVLARVQRNDPELLDGGLKTLADFANGAGKDVVGIPDRYNPPNVFKDVGGIVNVHRPVQSTIQGIPGVGTTARRILTGSTPDAVAKANAMFPGRAPGSFDPLPGLTPPPGQAWRSPSQMSLGDLPQGSGPPPFTLGEGANPSGGGSPPPQGSIPLSELLAHGVEQPAAPGLSAGPMGAPQGQGLPFTASPDAVGARPVQSQPFNPERVPTRIGDRFAGGGSPDPQLALLRKYGTRQDGGNQLSLQDMNDLVGKLVDTPSRETVGQRPQSVADMAATMSQGRAGGPSTPLTTTEPQLAQGPGVPDGTVAHTPQAPAVSHDVDEQTGAHTVTSDNGETHAQESGPFLISKRSDTAATAQGKGEGVARAETLIQQAETRGLRYSSDVSVSPQMQRVYDALKRKGYNVMRNPDAAVNPDTGNLVSNDPRKPVFIVRSRLSQAVGQ